MVGKSAGSLVERTRSLFAALNEGDIGMFIRSLAPDPVLDALAWGFGVYEGNRAIRRFLEDWMGSFEVYERTAGEVLDLGNGVVFAVAKTRGVPAGGRTEVRLEGVSVVVWTAGGIVRVINYRDVNEARVAAERLVGERG
jgi:ketosteroid isomerase-like protein